jgi:hypothetical protein
MQSHIEISSGIFVCTFASLAFKFNLFMRPLQKMHKKICQLSNFQTKLSANEDHVHNALSAPTRFGVVNWRPLAPTVPTV